ncbi:MAG: DUF835 domain-containing protein [Candidatus Thermoplasmatota archaeon]|nr:DUF835 domain-containing protein [Candidatus Thermoplasmatota archaeon]
MSRSRGYMMPILCFAIFTASSWAMAAPVGADEEVEVSFDFYPRVSAYAPGSNFSLNFTVTNVLADLSAFEQENDIEVFRISAWFSWMAPTTWESEEVDAESLWLLPGESQTFSLNITVPSGIAEATYGYMLKVEYRWKNSWGVSTPAPWTSTTYRDFVVKKESDGGWDLWIVALAGLALVLAVGAIGALLYHTSRRRKPEGLHMADASALGLAGIPPTAAVYPIIRAAPGERFPIEKGVIYLVKEKRPSIGFAMFKEAVANGAKGMLVAREHPDKLKQIHDFDAAKIMWLTRRVGVDHIDPTELSLLSLEISRFVEKSGKSVVLIEGLEYVITQNNFESVLRFVNHLHDFVLAHDCAVVIIIDPRVLSTRELALLERSARIVEAAEPVETRLDAFAEELDS